MARSAGPQATGSATRMPWHVVTGTPGTRVVTRYRTGAPRMKVLCILSSSNQLYSGIGRALFELSKRLADRVAYEFAIDNSVAKNVDLLLQFSAEHAFPVRVGPGRPIIGC